MLKAVVSVLRLTLPRFVSANALSISSTSKTVSKASTASLTVGALTVCLLAGCGVNAQMANAAPGTPSNGVIRAVKFDDAGAVKKALSEGLDPNAADPQGVPLLALAAREKSNQVAQVLIDDSRTNLEKTDQAGESALMLAAIGKDAPLAQALLAKGAKVDKSGWTPLHYAATVGDNEIATMLLNAHASVDALSPNGTTPLMMAARGGFAPTIALLLQHGANPTLKNQIGMTALDFGHRYSEPDSIKALTAAEAQWRAAHPQ